MKRLIYGLGVLALLVLVSCNRKPERPDSVLNESQQNYSGSDLNTPAATPPATPPAEPPQNAEGVWHYTCPDGHPGGSGSATPCAQCGKTLVHNQAYHNNANNATKSVVNQQQVVRPGEVAPGSTITFDPSNPGSASSTGTTISPPMTTPPTPEPAQNAAGVWHYTCGNGCAGGAGSAIACTGCGTTLAHNTAYHN